jgi:hypothetical protein
VNEIWVPIHDVIVVEEEPIILQQAYGIAAHLLLPTESGHVHPCREHMHLVSMEG